MSCGYNEDTNEYTDATGLLYLRARYYNPQTGRFFQLDLSRQETNPYQYANSNPLMFTDPSGLQPPPVCQNPFDSLLCLVVNTKNIYSKSGSSRNCALTPDDGQHRTDTVDDVFTDFICEYGPAVRVFGFDATLTKQLAESSSIGRLRAVFYYGGADEPFTGIGQMGPLTFLEAKFLDLSDGSTPTQFMGVPDVPVTVTDFLGGYDWRIYRTGHGTVRFEISDVKDLVSGTRIGFTRENVRDISVEEYIANPSAFNRSGYSTANLSYVDSSKYNVISVLSEKSMSSRNPDKVYGPGGGTMRLVFKWEELYYPGYTCQMYLSLPTLGGQLLPAGGEVHEAF